MQHDWVWRAVAWVNYPWVSRTDTKLYQQYPQLDPVRLMRHCFLLGVGGYWVGRLTGWNRGLCALGAGLPMVVKFLTDQWRLSSELTPYARIDFKNMPRGELGWSPKEAESKGEQAKGRSCRFESVRKLPFLELKIVQAQDLIGQLPSGYFR